MFDEKEKVMASRAYNENDLVIIATRVARGETVDVIADAVGRSVNAINEFLRIASNTDNSKKTASHIRFAFLLKQKQDEKYHMFNSNTVDVNAVLIEAEKKGTK